LLTGRPEREYEAARKQKAQMFQNGFAGSWPPDRLPV
jgi:hypothetical protein